MKSHFYREAFKWFVLISCPCISIHLVCMLHVPSFHMMHMVYTSLYMLGHSFVNAFAPSHFLWVICGDKVTSDGLFWIFKHQPAANLVRIGRENLVKALMMSFHPPPPPLPPPHVEHVNTTHNCRRSAVSKRSKQELFNQPSLKMSSVRHTVQMNGCSILEICSWLIKWFYVSAASGWRVTKWRPKEKRYSCHCSVCCWLHLQLAANLQAAAANLVINSSADAFQCDATRHSPRSNLRLRGSILGNIQRNHDAAERRRSVCSVSMSCLRTSVLGVTASSPGGPDSLQDWRNPNSIWPSLIISQPVASNRIPSLCLSAILHTYFILYWLSLSVFLRRYNS